MVVSITELFNCIRPAILNQFWENDRLVDEAVLESNVAKVIDELGIREGKFRVNGVYLFGSVLAVREKKAYRKAPNDLDLFFWLNDLPENDLSYNIKELVKDHCGFKGLESHAVVSYEHPFDYRWLGFSMADAYPLYLHNDWMNAML